MLAAVAITASVNHTPGQAHVSCGPCWFGKDVPVKRAVAVAIAHVASPGHRDEELAGLAFDLLAERVSVERGY
jgi:hypothetical protein